MNTLALALLHPGGTFSWTEWKLYPDFMIGWLLFGAAYFLFAGPLRHRFTGSRPVPAWRVASFAVAMAIMLVSLQGPMHELSDLFLFSAHMVQHLLVMMVMPAFLLAGIPDWMLRPALRIPGVRPAAAWLTRPLIAFAMINVLFGAWHFPGPYDLMMRDHDVHVAMHLMIMAAGVVTWWPVMSPLPELPRIPAPLQMVYLFSLGVPMMVVAALITLSEKPLYQWYVEAPRIFPLSALEDQALGGAIMWVPGFLILWAGITAVFFRWTHREAAQDERDAAAEPRRPEAAVVINAPPFPGG